MATKRNRPGASSQKPRSATTQQKGSGRSASRSSMRSTARTTVSGPSVSGPPVSADSASNADTATLKLSGTETLAESFPFNAAKPTEYGEAAAAPAKGQTAKPADPIVAASTLSEHNSSVKVGSGNPPMSVNPGNGPLDRVRVDSSRPHAHDQPGRAGRGQPEFPQGGSARAFAAGRFHPARENHPLRS